jgi:hypothetical protein
VRNGGLQGIEAVIERQQSVLAEGDDDRLFALAKNRRPGRLRPHRRITCRGPAPPLRDGLWIDSMAAGQRPYALLTMLYRSTDRLRRAGAPVKNLAHVPSLSTACESVPSYNGTEHLTGPSASQQGNLNRCFVPNDGVESIFHVRTLKIVLQHNRHFSVLPITLANVG